MRSFAAALCSAFLAFTCASGCIFKVATSPDDFPVVSNQLDPLPAGTRVEIVNNYLSSHMTRVESGGRADLQQMTQTAVVVLGRALESRNVALGAGGKRITLEVVGPGWTQGFGGYFARGTLTLNAYVAGTKISTWGEGSGTDGGRNFSAAITQAVERLLSKPELYAYLSKP